MERTKNDGGDTSSARSVAPPPIVENLDRFLAGSCLSISMPLSVALSLSLGRSVDPNFSYKGYKVVGRSSSMLCPPLCRLSRSSLLVDASDSMALVGLVRARFFRRHRS
jgi:hypothetical protein